MITIEIHSHVLDSTFDFVIDEHTEIRTVIEDVAQMMSQSDRSSFSGDVSELRLYSIKTRTVLCPSNTLYDYDTKTGDRLFII